MATGTAVVKTKRGRVWPWVLMGMLLALPLIAGATMRFGLVHGQEFSPGAFQRRSFLWYELPLIGIQLTPIVRNNSTNDLEQYVTQQKWVLEQQTGPTSWDLVRGSRGGGPREVEGEAAILCAYLDSQNADKELVWLKWSKEHPELAAVLWPHVAQLAREELYIHVPRLFRLALAGQDATQLSHELTAAMVDAYTRQALLMEQVGAPDLARGLREKAQELKLLPATSQSRRSLPIGRTEPLEEVEAAA